MYWRGMSILVLFAAGCGGEHLTNDAATGGGGDGSSSAPDAQADAHPDAAPYSCPDAPAGPAVAPCARLWLPGEMTAVPNDVWRSLALADLNEDGYADALFFGDTFYVAFGTRDGTFGPPLSLPFTANPGAQLGVDDVATVDLDGDGHLDLVFASELSGGGEGELAISLGNGDGTFADPVSYPMPTRPRQVAAGDLDEDGTPEVVVTSLHFGNNMTWSTVDVLHYLGAGVLGGLESYPLIGHGYGDLAVTDTSGDGRDDVLVGDEDTIEVLAADSTGALTASVSYDTSSGRFATGDFDGDGDTDIAVSQVNGPSGPAIALFANTGGAFAETAHLAASIPGGIRAGDLNGDGKPDLVVHDMLNYDYPFSDFLGTYINNGDGSFAAEVHHRAFDEQNGFDVGDVDGDGKLDIAEIGYLNEALFAHIGRGDGGFFEPVPVEGRRVIAVGDVNLDGNPDVITTSDLYNGWLLVSLGNGDGSFQPTITIGPAYGAAYAALGDISGDGKPDLLTLGFDTALVVYLGGGDGSFSAPTLYYLPATGNGGPVALADVNGDCQPDVVVVSRAELNPQNPKPGFLAVFPNLGNGVLGSGTFYPAATSVAVADFNGDRYPDILAGGLSGSTLMLSYGDGSFRTLPVTGSLSCVGDFNADTTPDVLGDGVVRLGNGDGTFTQQPSGIGGAQCMAVDLNGDSASDVACDNRVWLNEGNASFGAPRTYWIPPAVGTPPELAGAADFNRDGHPDLVMWEWDTRTPFVTSVLLARCLP